MVAFVRKFYRLVMLFPLLASIISCSSSSSGTTGISYTMELSPATASIAVGMQIPFTLTAAGFNKTDVKWTINGFPTRLSNGSPNPDAEPYGAITDANTSTSDLSFLYTAPSAVPSPTTFPITAKVTDSLNHTSTVTAQITIVPVPGYTNFSTAGNMITPRFSHTASLLSSGNILVAGGFSNFTSLGSLSSAELCTQTATFTATEKMSVPRAFHTATPLVNGNVLITGGTSAKTHVGTTPYGVPLSSAEVYNYYTNAFVATGVMTAARQLHTATRLQDGQVLITGGKDSSGNNMSSAEIYDPTAGAFTNISSMKSARSGHTATLLQNGDVLIAGGGDASGEIYDHIIKKFSRVSGIPDITGHTATLRNSFDVLITGGTSAGVTQNAGYLYSDGAFSAAVLMSLPRTGHAAALLANGDVILTGGDNGAGAVLASVEKFSGTAFSTPSVTMMTRRANHTATTLFNGNVMIIGGFNPYSTAKAVGSAEIFK